MLLLVYPPDFRRAYADEMEHALLELFQIERDRRGRFAAPYVACRALIDTTVEATALRFSSARSRRSRENRRVHSGAETGPGGLWRDIRYGARRLSREPVFGATALLTLALGLGTTTAVYSVYDAVLLRPPSEFFGRPTGERDGRPGGAGRPPARYY